MVIMATKSMRLINETAVQCAGLAIEDRSLTNLQFLHRVAVSHEV